MEAKRLIEEMKQDHRRVRAEVAKLAALFRPGGSPRPGSDAKVASLVAMLREEFRTHMAAEDDVLYPAVEAAVPAARATLAPLYGEHEELRLMLDRIAETLAEEPGPDRDEQLGVQIGDLGELLRIHVRKEESLVLSVTARLLGPVELEAIVERLHPERPLMGAPSTTNPSKGESR
ncbi:MAG: hemerythrin domain-containing protein [Hyphomicrobiales bacterium]